MILSNKYRIERMPDGQVCLEVSESDGSISFALILSKRRARTMATKLRNAARPDTIEELREYLDREAVPPRIGKAN